MPELHHLLQPQPLWQELSQPHESPHFDFLAKHALIRSNSDGLHSSQHSLLLQQDELLPHEGALFSQHGACSGIGT